MYTPTKIGYGYKLFEQDKCGNIYPLFIGKSVPTPMNGWVFAENIPTNGFAARPGWHCGMEIPSAPWLMDSNGKYKSRFKHGKRVWCIVEYDATNDYREEVSKLPGKCFKNKVPENGYYWFKEGNRGTWIITSAIKVVRILDEVERQSILNQNGYDEQAAFAPYKAAFAKRMKTIA